MHHIHSLEVTTSGWAEDPWEETGPVPTSYKRSSTKLYHNYSDYNSTNEEDQFDMDEDNVLSPPIVNSIPITHMDEDDVMSPPTVAPFPPPLIIHDNVMSPPTVAPFPPPLIIHVLVRKWVDTDKLLDPDDLNLLLKTMDILQEVFSLLLPSNDDLPVKELLDYKLPDIDIGCFTQTGASWFHKACPDKDLDLTRDISPKSWVYSL
ncbi:hypothetical protein BDR05DRAFT_946806 [Suillus weaverae]|nr:hypothetical protein BDR05DRAFT_946806 [Suillus weaverae]